MTLNCMQKEHLGNLLSHMATHVSKLQFSSPYLSIRISPPGVAGLGLSYLYQIYVLTGTFQWRNSHDSVYIFALPKSLQIMYQG